MMKIRVEQPYKQKIGSFKERIDKGSGTRMLVGSEFRTIFLGMDQFRDELLYSDVKGRNPFKDGCAREAVYRAIDIEANRRQHSGAA